MRDHYDSPLGIRLLQKEKKKKKEKRRRKKERKKKENRRDHYDSPLGIRLDICCGKKKKEEKEKRKKKKKKERKKKICAIIMTLLFLASDWTSGRERSCHNDPSPPPALFAPNSSSRCVYADLITHIDQASSTKITKSTQT